MMDVIPSGTETLKTWLVDSSGNIAVSGVGLAVLQAEITPPYSATTEEFDSPNEFWTQG